MNEILKGRPIQKQEDGRYKVVKTSNGFTNDGWVYELNGLILRVGIGAGYGYAVIDLKKEEWFLEE